MLQNRENNVKYLRLREGQFYVGKDKETPYGELEGVITNMYYKDEEYDGTPIRKLIVVMEDGEEKYQFGLNVESQNYNTFISFLKGADITQRLTLHPKVEDLEKDGKSFKRNSILVSQNGKYSKGYFTKDNMHGAPAWERVKVGKKNVIDKTNYLAFMEEFVTANYINNINVPGVEAAEEKPAPKKAKKAAAVVVNEEPDDKLPWDND